MHVTCGPPAVCFSWFKIRHPLVVPPCTALSRKTSPGASEEAVHALDSLAAIVQTLGPDTLAAGIVEPAVLGAAHRLAVQLALAD